jgi:cytochrome c-type biogenesis protein CcmH/NrfG
MSHSAQNKTGGANAAFTTVQTYTLAVITLAIGIAVGYFARGSAPPAITAETPQSASAPAATGNTPLGAAQLPGIGTMPQQQASSPEMVAKAVEPLLARLKNNPNDTDTLVKIANLYYDTQTYPQAIEYYERALKLEPGNPDVRTDLGTSYWYSGNPDKAIENFQKALAVDPNHPGTLFNLGVVRWQGKKDPKGAIAAWQKLLQTHPDYPQKEQVQMLIERAKMHGAGANSS